MVNFPIDKYLAQDYRNTLRTGDSPQNLDTDSPLLPVIDIQKGFPKPNSKQTLYKYNVAKINTAGTDTQIVSVTSTKKIYYLGAHVRVDAAGANVLVIFDATSGTGSASDGATTLFLPGIVTNTVLSTLYMMPLPVECINGIRCSITAAAGQTVSADIFYIEEIV